MVAVVLALITYLVVLPGAAYAAGGLPAIDADKVKGLSLYTGSGFFIAPNVVVTSGHVVKGAVRIEAVFNNQAQVTAAVIGVDEINDLALLRVSGLEEVVTPLTVANLDSVRQGDRVYAVGFPLPQVMGTQAKFSEGLISGMTGMLGDLKMYQISTPLQPGNSGGPVVNERAEVVGVVAGCLDAATMMKQGIYPQNVNYAIKITHLFGLLNRCSIVYGMRDYPRGPVLGAADVMEVTAKAVVLLMVIKQ